MERLQAFFRAQKRQLHADLLGDTPDDASSSSPSSSSSSSSPLARFDALLDILAGDAPPSFEHVLQRPYSFFLPRLPASPWRHPSEFAWVAEFEAAHAAIAAEMEAAVAARDDLGAFVEYAGDGAQGDKGAMTSAGRWKVFYLWHDFVKQEENCRRCPVTTALLERHADTLLRGMVCFSALEPGTTIVPHTGPSNMRLTCHLGLRGCTDCAVRVGGETRHYVDGRCVVFDDSFVHSVQHRGAAQRVTLMFDLWSPQVSAVERRAFERLMMASVRCGIPRDEFFHSLHLYTVFPGRERPASAPSSADDAAVAAAERAIAREVVEAKNTNDGDGDGDGDGGGDSDGGAAAAAAGHPAPTSAAAAALAAPTSAKAADADEPSSCVEQ